MSHCAADSPVNSGDRDIFSISLSHFGSHLMLNTQLLSKCILFELYFLHQKVIPYSTRHPYKRLTSSRPTYATKNPKPDRANS